MTAEHIIIAVSALGGIMGGMGMGGGTLLIPLLTMCAGVEQHLAQAINLISFLPMSIVALCIHGKNGYTDLGHAAPIAAVAVIGAVAGSFLTDYADGYTLRACYGAFLIALGAVQLIKVAVGKIKKMRKAKEIHAA